jgi:sulfide:quinone oxidoreductase
MAGCHARTAEPRAHVLEALPVVAAAVFMGIGSRLARNPNSRRGGDAMKRLVVLGAGTAGTIVVNKLRPKLAEDEWTITVVDPSDVHLYQPGFLFLPFGIYNPDDVVEPTVAFLPPGVERVRAAVDQVDADAGRVVLADGRELRYDYLIIATGTSPRPDQTPGMAEAMGGDVHQFYSYDGALALRQRLRHFRGGRLVVHVTEMPIKCPVAPLEFSFLAESYLAGRGIRDEVELTYVTPLEGAFTKPVASRMLGATMAARGIAVEPDFMIESVDSTNGRIVSYDEREVFYDLLVTVPVNMGADYVARSGLGDDLNYVPVDPHTLLSKANHNIFAIGDASDIPASKAGSVAHFSLDTFADNFLAHVAGKPMPYSFDGHANCFVESGHGKAMLIDFNYDTEPLPGKYPLPGVGPFSLLEETAVNHWGKLAFRWLYWHVLLPGRPLPLPSHMTMAGKRVPADRDAA